MTALAIVHHALVILFQSIEGLNISDLFQFVHVFFDNVGDNGGIGAGRNMLEEFEGHRVHEGGTRSRCNEVLHDRRKQILQRNGVVHLGLLEADAQARELQRHERQAWRAEVVEFHGLLEHRGKIVETLSEAVHPYARHQQFTTLEAHFEVGTRGTFDHQALFQERELVMEEMGEPSFHGVLVLLVNFQRF